VLQNNNKKKKFIDDERSTSLFVTWKIRLIVIKAFLN